MAELCPKCQADQIVEGSMVQYGGSTAAVFRPTKTRFATLSIAGGVSVSDPCWACACCGLVWAFTDVEKLEQFRQAHCYRSSETV